MPGVAPLRSGEESEGREADGVRRGAATSTASIRSTGFALRPLRQRRRPVRIERAQQRRHHRRSSSSISTRRSAATTRMPTTSRSARGRRRERDQARISGRADAFGQRRPHVDSDLRQRDVHRRPAAITTAGSTSRCASALRQAAGNYRQHGSCGAASTSTQPKTSSIDWMVAYEVRFVERSRRA